MCEVGAFHSGLLFSKNDNNVGLSANKCDQLVPRFSYNGECCGGGALVHSYSYIARFFIASSEFCFTRVRFMRDFRYFLHYYSYQEMIGIEFCQAGNCLKGWIIRSCRSSNSVNGLEIPCTEKNIWRNKLILWNISSRTNSKNPSVYNKNHSGWNLRFVMLYRRNCVFVYMFICHYKYLEKWQKHNLIRCAVSVD